MINFHSEVWPSNPWKNLNMKEQRILLNFFFDKTVQCRWAAGYLVLISYFFFDLSACSCYTAFKALPSLHCYLRPSLALIQYKSRSDDDVKGFPNFFFFFFKVGFFFREENTQRQTSPKNGSTKTLLIYLRGKKFSVFTMAVICGNGKYLKCNELRAWL